MKFKIMILQSPLGGEKAPSNEHPLPALVSCSPSACFQEEHAELYTTASCCGKAELHPYIWLQWRWEGKKALPQLHKRSTSRALNPRHSDWLLLLFFHCYRKTCCHFFLTLFLPPPLTKMRDSKLNSEQQISQRARCFVFTSERAPENSVWYHFYLE